MKSKMLKASLNSYVLESFEVFTHKYGGNAHAVPEETCNAEYSATTKFAKAQNCLKVDQELRGGPNYLIILLYIYLSCIHYESWQLSSCRYMKFKISKVINALHISPLLFYYLF